MSEQTSTRSAMPRWAPWAILALLFVPALVILAAEGITQVTDLREDSHAEATHSPGEPGDHAEDEDEGHED